MGRHYEWDDYFWPGTQVLVNKFGITDPGALRRVEYLFAARRQREITDGKVVIPATFDAEHLRAAHAHLFGDVYEWAGQWRTVQMSKDSSVFAETPVGVEFRLAQAAGVAAGTDWPRVDREGFAQAVGGFYAEINHAHSFREGNGRVGKLLLSQLAERSRFVLDFDRISPQEWNQVSERIHPRPFSGMAPDPGPLVPVFRGMTVDRNPPPVIAGGHSPALQWAVENAQKAAQRPIAPGGAQPGRGTGYGNRPRQQERDAGYER